MFNIQKPNFQKFLLYLVIFFSLFRLAFIWYPDKYVFDEVYHAFTAKEYLKWEVTPWVWWSTPPAGVAYEWTHPPLAKEIMSVSMLVLHNQSPWVWRVPGVMISWLSIFMVYLIAKRLFDKENPDLSTVGLLSALVFSIDGLSFVQARTGMNDAYVVAFLLTALYFSLGKRWVLTSIFWGLALSSKWTAVYLLPLLGLIALSQRQPWKVRYLVLIPGLIYLASYLPLFLLGESFSTFTQLQQQMWWYHTQLKATHDYASPWWSWPLNLYPVWYYVQYTANGWIGNIFASGNLPVFLFGFTSIIMLALQQMRKYSVGGLLVILGYLSFIVPWALSPRIMFLYHYSPCLPFLSIALGYQLNRLWQDQDSHQILYIILGVIIAGFVLLYPYLAGIPLPNGIMQLFFLTNLTKNPFAVN